jgi:hypothetical protein
MDTYLIPSVPLALMDGRSTTLRLSQGALVRTMQATGIDVAEMSKTNNIGRMGFMARLIYECSPLRKSMPYDEFSDLVPVNAGEVVNSLFARFGEQPKPDAAASPNPESVLTGSNDGQSDATISDSPTPSSGS